MSGPHVATHLIKSAALEAVGRTLADVLSECLFWMQSGEVRDDGRRAIWKTGPELAQKLGMSPRTANRHMKELRDLGYWEIRYRPRRGSTSPVTWLMFSELSEALLEAARVLSETDPRQGRRRTVGRSTLGRPDGSDTNHRMSQNEPLLQRRQSDRTQPRQQEAFLHSKERAEDGRKEPAFQEDYRDRGREKSTLKKAPTYARAREEDRELVTDFCEQAAARGLPEWDTVSCFTWQHAGEIRRKLIKAGLDTREDRRSFIEELLERWVDIRGRMDYRFSSHQKNRLAPSPMALAMEFKSLFEVIRPSPPPSLASQGFKTPSSLDDGF